MSAVAPLIEIRDLARTFRGGRTIFGTRKPQLTALRGVSLNLVQGETLGIVGESGCGKSTLGRSILRLIEPTAGRVVWQGRSLTDLSAGEMRKARRDLSIIFQDPVASLNPSFTVGFQIEEVLRINLGLSGKAARERALDLLIDKRERDGELFNLLVSNDQARGFLFDKMADAFLRKVLADRIGDALKT